MCEISYIRVCGGADAPLMERGIFRSVCMLVRSLLRCSLCTKILCGRWVAVMFNSVFYAIGVAPTRLY